MMMGRLGNRDVVVVRGRRLENLEGTTESDCSVPQEGREVECSNSRRHSITRSK
jgi:hypothetical protein